MNVNISPNFFVEFFFLGRFLKELSSLAARKRTIECDEKLNSIAKRRRIDELTLNFNGTRCKVVLTIWFV